MYSYEKDAATLKSPLETAKDDFRTSMLQNDTFFAVLQHTLKKSGEENSLLPDFGLEPVIRRLPNKASVIGVRINRAMTTSGLISASVASYEQLAFGNINPQSGVFKLNSEFETALEATGHTAQDAKGIITSWQTASSEIRSAVPEPLVLSCLSGTFELESGMASRNIPIMPTL